MRFDVPLKIAAAELWLPDARETADDAVRAGILEPERARANDYAEVPVSDIPPPQMAVRAATAALQNTTAGRDEIGLLVHAWTYYQGQDYWEPVHYIINELSLPRAVPLGVSLGCNGGIAGVEAAACRLVCDSDIRAAVLTTAERFSPPQFDRWRANLDVTYGDAATALVLDREDGPFELLSTATVAATEFEGMYRAPWATAPFQHEATIDIRSKLRNFLATGNGPRFAAVATDAVLRTVTSALAQAGLTPDDPRIRIIAPPRFGAELIERSYRSVLAGLTKAETLNLGRHTGHLGAGDMVANLADIARARMLEPGQVALMLSATAGFTWSCMVVRAT
ncbi:ketoacyl-ACP synthase III family protein [Peterkaempfera sp. SMS 1(5)a]|uniref:ketoacyl-ACP synthase III family protein n=1 Tax=Peterkaempfera podocarpi TaxID=3232308 RepID=UPI00366AE478